MQILISNPISNPFSNNRFEYGLKTPKRILKSYESWRQNKEIAWYLGFYNISTLAGYLMPDIVHTYIY